MYAMAIRQTRVGKTSDEREVSVDEARRIAVRAQLLDGSASGVLDTVHRLGFLQLDPIATVATPQELVLWSRLRTFDRTELDRLLWEERVLFEWNAFVWPVEALPILRGLIRRWRTSTHYSSERWVREFVKENPRFRRYILRELDRRGPLPGRAFEDRAKGEVEDHRWFGSRRVGLMLESLHLRGEIAVAGRLGKQRLWDLAGRVYPEGDALTVREAEHELAERRRRSLGVRLEQGRWLAHPDALDGSVPDRATLLSPFDRLIHDRNRTEALWDFHYRLEMYVPPAKREYGYYVLPLLVGDRLVGRLEPVLDRKAGVLTVKGAWGDTSRAGEALTDLAAFLGAELDAPTWHLMPEA
jgi:uncharacterized protein YcaQ